MSAGIAGKGRATAAAARPGDRRSDSDHAGDRGGGASAPLDDWELDYLQAPPPAPLATETPPESPGGGSPRWPRGTRFTVSQQALRLGFTTWSPSNKLCCP